MSDAARRYRAALTRLVNGTARHADHAGKPVRITPAAVAREAGMSRNPLYASHRDILEEIEIAAASPAPAKDLAAALAASKAEVRDLREAARVHAAEKRALASEHLTLLHRARAAEERLVARDKAVARLERLIRQGRP
ncbi:MAG: hypothetical protein NW206_12060 [Hyphomonadaceae bacterium]|nr:hypothetical protein [Hyphomonadaceae bacterium]